MQITTVLHYSYYYYYLGGGESKIVFILFLCFHNCCFPQAESSICSSMLLIQYLIFLLTFIFLFFSRFPLIVLGVVVLLLWFRLFAASFWAVVKGRGLQYSRVRQQIWEKAGEIINWMDG